MGIVLFDRKVREIIKPIIIRWLSPCCLFDGYLTESTVYPHFGERAYLTEPKENYPSIPGKPRRSSISLFDGYLTTPVFCPSPVIIKSYKS